MVLFLCKLDTQNTVNGEFFFYQVSFPDVDTETWNIQVVRSTRLRIYSEDVKQKSCDCTNLLLKRSLGQELTLSKERKGLWFCIWKKNLLETLFSLIKITLFYCVRQWLGIWTIFCATGSSVPASSSSQAVEWGWEIEASRCTKTKNKTLSDQPPPQKMGVGRSDYLLSVIQFVYMLCTCTNTHRVNLLSAIYCCLIQRTIVFRVFGSFFFLTVLKVLEMYWLLTIL